MDPTTQTWLALQCRFAGKVSYGVVLLGQPGTGPFNVMARWPQDRHTPALLENFSLKFLRTQQTSAGHQSDSKGKFTVVCCPLVVGGAKFGAITLLLKGRDSTAIHNTIRSLRQGCEWFAWLARERKQLRDGDNRLVGFVEILALALKHEDLEDAAQGVAEALKRRLACGRVSVGLVQQQHSRLIALTDHQRIIDTVHFRQTVEQAMDEAADQHATVCMTAPLSIPEQTASEPAPQTGLITQAHRQLMQQREITSVCSVPMIHNGDIVGILTLEQLKDDQLDDTTLRFCEQVALLLGPIFKMKQPHKTQRLAFTLATLRLPVKLLLAGAAIILSVAAFLPWQYQVTTRAVLESREKQVISAAQDGYIATASVKAGARVKNGQVLARMDSRDLLLEQKKWQGTLAQSLKAYNSALGLQDRVKINVHKAKLDQANAQLALIDNQLDRLELKAPFDGLVVAGDLSQSLGAPVKRGDILFEVAKSDDYQLILEVDEQDIVDLDAGQKGRVLLASLPDQTLEFRIDLITPIARSAEGKHYFQVRATLLKKPSSLNPGMTGLAKVEVGKRALAWIWFHQSYYWLRFLLWQL